MFPESPARQNDGFINGGRELTGAGCAGHGGRGMVWAGRCAGAGRALSDRWGTAWSLGRTGSAAGRALSDLWGRAGSLGRTGLAGRAGLDRRGERERMERRFWIGLWRYGRCVNGRHGSSRAGFAAGVSSISREIRQDAHGYSRLATRVHGRRCPDDLSLLNPRLSRRSRLSVN